MARAARPPASQHFPPPVAGATRRRAAGSVLGAALVALLVSCGPAGEPPRTAQRESVPAAAQIAAFPATVSDDVGRRVQIAAAPKRIVSTAPSTTEILFALGLGERVVAVTTFCNYPAEAASKSKVGGLRPNLEMLVALEPDLVLAVRGTPPDVVAGLDGLGVPAIVLNPADFSGVLADIRLVGRVTGALAAAERHTVDMQRRWDAVAARARAATKKPRVLYEVDATNPAAVSTAGPGTFIDAMITAAGGVNVMAALAPGQQYPRANAEVVLQANPEIIILGSSPFGQTAELVAQRPGWNVVDAVQKRAVVTITATDADVLSRAGPRVVDGLELIALAIQPELFR